jgi:hypothetical protein
VPLAERIFELTAEVATTMRERYANLEVELS